MSAFTALNGGSPKPTDNSLSTADKAASASEETSGSHNHVSHRESPPRRRDSWGHQSSERQQGGLLRQYAEALESHKRKRSGSAEGRQEPPPAQERTPDATSSSSKLPSRDHAAESQGASLRDGLDDSQRVSRQTREERRPLENHKPATRQPPQSEESAGEASRRHSNRLSEPIDDHNQSSDAEERSITVYAYPTESRQDNILQHDPKKRKRNFSNRTKTGCLTCRKRKKKCDEEKPECTNCVRGGFVCAGYPPQRGASWQKPDNKTPAIPLESKDPSYVPPGAYGMPQPSSYPSQNPYSAPPPSKRDPLPHYRGGALRIDPPQGRPLITDDDRQTASTRPSSSVASPDNKLSAMPYTPANAFPTPISANTQPPHNFGDRLTKEYRVPPLHDLSRQDPEPSHQQTGSQLPQINILHPTRTSSPATQHSTIHHQSSQRPSSQHPSSQHPSSQHPSSQHPSAQHPSSQHPSSQHPSSQHPSSQHPPSQHPSSQHPSSQHPASQHPSSQHPASQHPSSSAQVAQLALSHSFAPQHRTQKEEMLSGRHYYPFDKELCLERERCATACWRFNNLTSPASIGVSPEERARLFSEILAPRDPVRVAPNEISPITNVGRVGRHVAVETPFNCDYGYNIIIGNTVSIGRNCTINDVCEVKIGDNCVIGPNVSIYTATLPIDPKKRQGGQGPQLGRPIVIEPDCWIGGGAVILPGKVIGKGSTVGAGSIVTKDVPPFTVVAGNPARVLRGIAS